jgi:cyclase
MQRIGRNIYVGSDICNHSFVVTREGIVMIDTPAMIAAAKAWQKEIGQYGPVTYLINTEGHMDHFTGNFFFQGTVVAHEGVRRAIQETSMEDLKNWLALTGVGGTRLPDQFHFRPPTITFTHELTLYSGDHTFQLISMPGHTASEAVVYVKEERTVFTGDNVVNQTMPSFIHALPYQWLDSLKQLKELDIDVVVPGHGPVGDKKSIGEMSASVQMWIDSVREAIEQGMTSEEAQDRVSLLHLYPDPQVNEEKRILFQRMSVARLYDVLKCSNTQS